MGLADELEVCLGQGRPRQAPQRKGGHAHKHSQRQSHQQNLQQDYMISVMHGWLISKLPSIGVPVEMD